MVMIDDLCNGYALCSVCYHNHIILLCALLLLVRHRNLHDCNESHILFCDETLMGG